MTTSPPTNAPPFDLSLARPELAEGAKDELRSFDKLKTGLAQYEQVCPITLIVNGQPHTTTVRTLQEWVDAQDAVPTALATAVNGTFVPRTARAQHELHDGDAVLTFQPIQGG